MKANNRTQQTGFTLVEVIVVMAILAVMLPVVFSILFSVAKQQSKIYRLSETKQQGDFALAFMKSQIRDYADRIYNEGSFNSELCYDPEYPSNAYSSTSGNDFIFTKIDTNNDYFQFTLEPGSNQLVFNDNGQKQDLTTALVQVSNFNLSCVRNTSTAQPFVIISFTVNYTTDLATAKPEDIAVLNYKSIVRLR